ncbi:MAG: T9SS type A sorting domain-containing protein [Taibaiella sp.]|nr:T9SS type A sorting domain-containing protein [Taibaiella sp.]
MKTSILILFIFLLFPFVLFAQNITTVAGTGTFGYSGDGGPATAARIWLPAGLAFDANGNMYSTDYGGYKVRKTNSTGIITLVAGLTAGGGGDGGPAALAQLRDPKKLAFDMNGNLYIADDYGEVVRKVDTTGIISRYAGNYSGGFSGDGGQASAAQLSMPSGVSCDTFGNLYISDAGNACIRKVAPDGTISTIAGKNGHGYGGDGGLATAAKLWGIQGIFAAANGDLYIVDGSNNRIRKINTSGIITTVAGNGTAGYSGDGGSALLAELKSPYGITFDTSGNMYLADYGNHCIRKVSKTGIISTVAGNATQGYSGDGGAAVLAQLNNPTDVAIDGNGDLFIADFGNHRIRKVSLSSAVINNFPYIANVGIKPNPATQEITISADFEIEELTIVDIMGKATKLLPIIFSNSNRKESLFNVADLSPGIYFLTINDEYAGRFMKK